MTRAKVTAYYANSQIAKREVKEAGYDEAILLDTDGYVGRTRKYLIIRDGILKTTPLTSILEESPVVYSQLAKEKKIPAVEQRFTRDETLYQTRPSLPVRPPRSRRYGSKDGRVIGNGKPGPIHQRTQAFFDIVHGKDQTQILAGLSQPLKRKAAPCASEDRCGASHMISD
jgi:branched-chain amino acid aminotransferase